MPFIECYESGEGTPNPDVYCNSYIKFSSLRKHVIQKMGFDMMATGHYARLDDCSNNNEGAHSHSSGLRLLRGIDDTKDQSYFLCTTQVRIIIVATCRSLRVAFVSYLLILLIHYSVMSDCILWWFWPCFRLVSFTLFHIQISCFEKVLFPLGHLTKAEIKRMAADEPLLQGLNVLKKKESMGVCFIGKRTMSDFLPQYFTPTGGRLAYSRIQWL
jgi:tRNA U34 2-thiouridine synthase MnmA/TrmU